MSRLRLIAPAVILGLALLASPGCKNTYEHDETGLYAANNQGFNALGIVDYSPESYVDVGSTTADVHSDQLVKRKNISGDNISFLWGAFNYMDY